MIPLILRPTCVRRNRFRQCHRTSAPWLAGVGILLVAGTALADIQQDPSPRREDKDKDSRQENIRRAAEIPTPSDATVTVLRGVPTRLTLTATAALRQSVIFRIGDRPAHGALSDPRPSADSNTKAIVTYTAGPGTAESDMFTFRVKHRDTPTSGSATVKIRIVDPKAELTAPEAIDFGETVVGETAVRPLILENKGTAAFTGLLQLEPPWRLLQDIPEVRLEPGARLEVRLGFSPLNPGDSTHTLQYPGIDGLRTKLAGRALGPVALNPSLIQLTWEPTTRVRSATTTLTNRLATPVDYVLSSSARLQFSAERGSLPANGSSDVTVTVPLPDATDLQTMVAVTALGVRTEVPLTAPPAPALLTLASTEGWKKSGDSLELAEGATEGALVVTNEGGEAAALTTTLPGGWTSPGLENAATLGPRESRKILLVPPATRTTAATGAVELRLQQERLVVPVSAPATTTAATTTTIGPDALLTAVPSILTESPAGRDLTAEERQIQFMIDTIGIFPQDTRFDRSLPELESISVPVKRLKPKQVDLILKSAGAQYSIRVFRDQYRPPPGGTRPTRHWLPVDGLKWKSSGNSVSTTLDNLLPGSRVLLRFAVLTPDGRVGPPSVPIAITTPAPPPRRWPWIIGIPAVGGLIAWWWRRRQRS